MFCKECGTEINEDSGFCNSCGTAITSSISQNKGLNNKCFEEENNYTSPKDKEKDHSFDYYENGEVSFREQDAVVKKHKIFHSDNEILIDTLGSGFLSSLFVQDSFKKSVLFCSNKRVYQKGKLFERNLQGKITYYNGEKSVDLKEITGLSYYIEDPIHRFKMVAITLILGIIGFIIAQEQRGELQAIISIASGAMIGISIMSLIIYGLKKGKWFVIEYAGGIIMSNCNWYSKKSIRRFMKNISIQKDKI